MATFINSNKNTSPSFVNYIRHGKFPRISDIADYTFTTVVFPDGTQLKDVTFSELADTVYANVNKSASPSFSNATRN